MIREFFSKQFIIFLCTGVAAAVINFGSRILYSHWFDFSIAVVLAYITGMVTAFVLAKLFVFKQNTQNLYRSAFFFCIVNLAAVAQTLLISMGLAYYFLPLIGVTVFVLEIAHAVGVAFPVFTSYIGHKRWSFRQ
ncbi:MAG: GtrA family protein [Gammaproteobacteria bacterium]|jgi:putative flippase GtrA